MDENSYFPAFAFWDFGTLGEMSGRELSQYEQETIVNYNAGEQTATVGKGERTG